MLFPLIIGFALVGAYSVDNSAFGIVIMGIFSLVGYTFRKLDFPLAPFALTLILGPLMERTLRQSLDMSDGSFQIFFDRPLSATLVAIAFSIIALSMAKFLTTLKADSEI